MSLGGSWQLNEISASRENIKRKSWRHHVVMAAAKINGSSAHGG